MAEFGKLGLEAHPTKTGVYESDPSTACMTAWNFLGFTFRGWLAEPAVEELMRRVRSCVGRGQPEQVRSIVDGWTAYYVLPSAHLEVLSELEASLWPWGPFRKPSATTLRIGSVALRGPKGPRAGRVALPGVSGGFLP